MRLAKYTPSEQEQLKFALWLLEETSLTFNQISICTGLPRTWVQFLEDETLPNPPKDKLDPVAHGRITENELNALQKDPNRIPAIHVSRIKNLHITPTILTSNQSKCFDEDIYEYGVVKVWVATYGRNAWHSTWIGRYGVNWSMWLDLRSAKSKCEAKRTQGSVFYISEQPALYIRGKNFTIVGSLVNRYSTMKPLITEIELSGSLHAIANWGEIMPIDSALFHFYTENISLNTIGSNSIDYQHLSSYSQGSHNRLGWRPHQRHNYFYQSIFDCRQIIANICASASEDAFDNEK